MSPPTTSSNNQSVNGSNTIEIHHQNGGANANDLAEPPGVVSRKVFFGGLHVPQIHQRRHTDAAFIVKRHSYSLDDRLARNSLNDRNGFLSGASSISSLGKRVKKKNLFFVYLVFSL